MTPSGRQLLLLVYSSLLVYGKGQATTRESDAFKRETTAKEVLKYMNTEADPCEDFYEFACGKWINDEPTSVQTEIEARVRKDVQTLLDEPIITKHPLSTNNPQTSNNAVRKVKEFYKSCLAVDASSQLQQVFLMNFVKQHGGLELLAATNWNENFNWVKTVANLRSNYGLDILIGLEIDVNVHTNRGNSIYLSEPKETLIPAHLCSAIANEELNIHDQFYEELQHQISENMQSWFSLKRSQTEPFAGDIVRFEFQLCKHMRRQHSMPNEADLQGDLPYRTGQSRLSGNRNSVRHPRQTLQQLMQQFGNVINFKQYVDTVFESPISDLVYLRSEEYFHQLRRIIAGNSRRTIANYIIYRALAAINFPLDENHIERPSYCVQLVLRYFPKVIGAMYNSKYALSQVRSDVDIMYGFISQTFADIFENEEWMDVNIRRAAKQKLANFKMAFPFYEAVDLSNLLLDHSNYWHKLEKIMKYKAKEELNRLYNFNFPSTLDTVEAPDVRMKMLPASSEVLTGWGLLQPPYYNYHYPNAMKYAFVGQRIARELTTAFDEQGWNSHPLSPMRWDEFTLENFHNRSKCFREQYSNYLYNNPDAFRNASLLRELIADSSGLNIAFRTYLAWLDGIDTTDYKTLSRETLKDVNYTNTQLFFISFAQQRCIAAPSEEEPPPEFLPLEKHTPERYNVNGPLSNNEEFAREFGCSAGTQMNPDDKCVIY